MKQEKVVSELFSSVELIADKVVKDAGFTGTIKGKIVEKIKSSDSYIVSYQNVEIVASSLGSVYKLGDEVIVLVPENDINTQKFILGRTNSRVPTISISEDGDLSDLDLEHLQEMMDEINNILSDGKLTPKEKGRLALDWEQTKGDHKEVIDAAKDYPSIDLTDLEQKFNTLKAIMEAILSDMENPTEEDLDALKIALVDYINENKKKKNEVLEEIKKDIAYNIKITSTNGESFKNGLVETVLKIVIYKGKKMVTDSIEAKNIRWFKLDGEGNKISGWSHTGRELIVTSDDVDIKQLFLCEVYEEEALLASDMITLVDLTDGDSLDLEVSYTVGTSQVYDKNSGNFRPNWEVQSPKFIATSLRNGENATPDSTFTWKLNNEEINKSDPRFIIEANTLTIKKNILNQSDNIHILSCACLLEDGDTILKDSFSTDLLLTVNGENGEDGSSALQVNFIHPLGTVIRDKDSDRDHLDIEALVYFQQDDVTEALQARKWYYRDTRVVPGHKNYDIDGGSGWSLISKDNTLDGNLSGFDTKVLRVKEGAIDSSSTFKCFVRFAGNAASSSTTLIDLKDPVQIMIEGSGGFKNDSMINTFTAKVFIGGRELSKEEIESKYTLSWSLFIDNEIVKNSKYPKEGIQIDISGEEIPLDKSVYVNCNLLGK